MKRHFFLFSVVFLATVFFTSCGSKCDKNDPSSDCYEKPCDKTDPLGDCYDPMSDPVLITDKGVVINGVKWATRNIDAPGTFAATPESSGMFYQWNRKIGWSTTDQMVNSDNGTAWDATNPEGTEWTAANDPCPAGWRVPTHSENISLLDTAKVNKIWTTHNDIGGILFTDKATGDTLFLPAAGYRNGSDGMLGNVGSNGYYWSSTQYTENYAYYLKVSNNAAIADNAVCRYGRSVRAVSNVK